MWFPLHCPDCKQLLVTFRASPFFLLMTNPSLQVNTHFDPYALLQEGRSFRLAPSGVSNCEQVTALIRNINN